VEDSHNEELQALTQLVSYQLAINILPFDKKYSEFIHYGLQQVVRTSKCRVCLFFTQEPVGDTISDSCNKCDFYKCSNDEHKCNCLLFNEKDTLVIPVQTVRKSFGYIALNNTKKIKPNILASIRNFVNVIALNIENIQHKDILEAQKKELSEYRNHAEELMQFITQVCNSVDIGIFSYDHNLRFKIWNHFMEEFTGIPESQVIGKNPTEVFPFLEETDVIKNVKRALNGENLDATDVPFILPVSGKSGWSTNRNIPFRNVNGEIIGVIGTVFDISERKKLEEDLKSINERFALATTAATISVWEHDFITDMIKIDDNFNHIYGSTQGNYQIKGKDFIEFIHPDDIDIIEINIEEGIKSDKNINFELRGIRPDGNIRNISVYGKIVKDKTNKPIKFIGANMDITDSKNAELAIKESETKLRQLNADKDRFIAILSHDLKSPFNSLLGLSELLATNIHKYDIDKIDNLAININQSAQRSFNLLEDLLQWANAQQGNISFKPQNLDFTDVCQDTLEVLQPSANEKNIAINYSTVNHLNVFADADMLKTVLRNLVSNAIKFTNNDGVININAEQNSENVTISVHDNGIGIPPDNQAKLFDISEVLTTKGTAKETGTGLGLLLCKEFVEKHGGKIWVVSEVNKGSDFRFTLPCNAEPHEVNVVENVEKNSQRI